MQRINQSLKKILTELTHKTGNDWVSPLLCPLQCSQFSLYSSPDLFEIIYVRLIPILPNLREELLPKFFDQKFLSSLQVLSQVQKQLWSHVNGVYEKTLPPMARRPDDHLGSLQSS